ncbi:hypothetical protein SAMN02910354_00180 [Basfia succiniciproducens]|uniref:Lipoprotein n=1 Tax=Basfia succiniciproducens TaxID=653940 RepID=A0A1G5ADG0_9PAST|nr:hypothetical protein A4G13_03515 [Basfia succiniciproducens]SCX75904.1 hypothetical protein SAMN02910354_00180 [Basfia succiniciproducens]
MRVIFFLLFLFLSGCIDLLTYRDSYTIDSMAYWEHVSSKEIASLKVRNDCFDKINKNNGFTQDRYAKCLYEQGYRFKTNSLLYCYHRKEKCEVYDKYRK